VRNSFLSVALLDLLATSAPLFAMLERQIVPAAQVRSWAHQHRALSTAILSGLGGWPQAI
jgi:hypothetical protein